MNKLMWFFVLMAVVTAAGLSTTCCVPMPPPTVLPVLPSQPPALDKVITSDGSSWMPINVFGRPEENTEGIKELMKLVDQFKQANPQLEVTHYSVAYRPDTGGNWTGWRAAVGDDETKRANCAFTYGLWIFHKPKPSGAGSG